jgi:putative flavoprotein involved in K+ transport
VLGGGDSWRQILNEVSKDATRTVYFSGDTGVKSLLQFILGKTHWWQFTLIDWLIDWFFKSY